MPHLSLEALAGLVDERPTGAQQAHLDACDRCRTELIGLRRQTRRLGALPDADPPAHAWTLIEARLRDEALVVPDGEARPPASVPVGARLGRRWAWPLGIAASIALFLLGGVVGATLRGPASPTAVATHNDVETAWIEAGRAASSPEEAARVLRGAEASYMAALARLHELTGSDRPTDPIARLAALESIVLTTRAALNQAPADPVINGYHLGAVAEREAMLRRLAAAQADDWF